MCVESKNTHPPENQLQSCWLNVSVSVPGIRPSDSDPLPLPSSRLRVAAVDRIDAKPQDTLVFISLD